VLATIIRGFSLILSHPVEIFLAKINPSAKYESDKVPPGFLIILM
jgi:hypothetical protein